MKILVLLIVCAGFAALFSSLAVAAFLLYRQTQKVRKKRRPPPAKPDPAPIEPGGGGGGGGGGNGGEGALIDTLLEGTLQANIKPGQGAGKGHALDKKFRTALPDAVIAVFQVNFASGFEWGCKGKIGGLKVGPGTSSGCNYSSNGASNRLMWNAGGGAYSYVYIPQGSEGRQPKELSSPPNCGQDVWKEDFAGVFKTGTWHTIRLGIKLNTPGSADGKLLFGVDGTVKTLSGVVWRLDSGIKIEGFDVAVFHGGPCSANESSSVQIRNIKVYKWD